jgi:hypothetical protein
MEVGDINSGAVLERKNRALLPLSAFGLKGGGSVSLWFVYPRWVGMGSLFVGNGD